MVLAGASVNNDLNFCTSLYLLTRYTVSAARRSVWSSNLITLVIGLTFRRVIKSELDSRVLVHGPYLGRNEHSECHKLSDHALFQLEPLGVAS